MSVADVNGTHLYYERAGSGPALLFIHGATLDHRMWRRQIEALAPRFHTVVYDLRGFGRSAPPDGEFKHWEDAAALIDHLGLDRVVVIGHSIGGLYGLELALGRPDRVAGYVALCMSGLGAPPFPADTIAMFGAVRAAARDDLRAAKAIWAASGWFASAREVPALAAELDEMLDAYSGWYWTHDSPARNLAPPAVEQLAALRVPVLVIDGQRDLDYNHAVADVLAARIPGARLVRLADTGHMANMEAPDVVNRAIARHAMQLVAPSPPTEGPLTADELQLAGRNKGMPLEGLRHDITPVGMHYLLVHFDIPAIDATSWRLRLGGRVARPRSFSLDDLRARPRRTIAVTLECAGNGRARLSPRPVSQPWLVEAVGTAEWTGTPLAPLLAEAGLQADAVEVVFTGADHGTEKGYEHDYARSLAIDDAMGGEVMLVDEMNGRPLEPQHGAPLRLLVPGWYGMTQVKWLSAIDVVAEPFAGYQQQVAYWYKASAAEVGTPVQRIRPRALMIPPGFPDFLTRRRIVERGAVELRGRAWSGHGAIARVEVAVDGTWHDATVGAAPGPHAWQAWTFGWTASEGEHRLVCRATDVAGNVQPVEPPWNVQGMGNNLVQEVRVIVT